MNLFFLSTSGCFKTRFEKLQIKKICSSLPGVFLQELLFLYLWTALTGPGSSGRCDPESRACWETQGGLNTWSMKTEQRRPRTNLQHTHQLRCVCARLHVCVWVWILTNKTKPCGQLQVKGQRQAVCKPQEQNWWTDRTIKDTQIQNLKIRTSSHLIWGAPWKSYIKTNKC